MMKWSRRIAVTLLTAVMAASPAKAWWGDGHALLAAAGVAATPAEVPAFFRAGTDHVAHLSYDPDLFKNRATPHLYDAEHPEHFFDVELVEGMALPDDRYAFVEACQRAGVRPQKVGFLPYALAEWTERLAVAFAEHRRWPDDPVIHSKCLNYAGFIAHYAADAAQPLHLTIHFDGRVQEDGTVVQKGIHEKVDGLIQAMGFDPIELGTRAKVVALDSLRSGILAQVHSNRTLIDQVYELGPHLGDLDSAHVRAFAQDRAVAAASFTASLYLTAWRLSAGIELPGWHERR